MRQSTPQLSWDTLEYEPKKKRSDWYWALGIIAVAGAVAAILLGNILFGILILLAAVTVGMTAMRKPRDTHIELSAEGVRVGKNLYPFSEIESFWIVESVDHRDHKLLLRTKSGIVPTLDILIPQDIDKEEIADFLAEFLAEVAQEEPLLHRISDRLGF